MAKKRQDKKIFLVSAAALALVVALFLFGGQITGKGYTSTFSWTVVDSSSCNVLNTTAACPGTLALDSTTACGVEVLLENDGNNAVTVTLKMAAAAGTEIGGTSPYIEANTVDSESGSSTENNINLTASPQTIASAFGYGTSADLIGNNFTIHIPADASVSGAQNTVLTYACA